MHVFALFVIAQSRRMQMSLSYSMLLQLQTVIMFIDARPPSQPPLGRISVT